MLKFKRDKNRVVVDAYSMMITEIKEIWVSDRTRLKDIATEHLTYMHLIAQIDDEAPYFTSPVDDVEELVQRNIYRKKENPISTNMLAKIHACVTAYQEAYETAEIRAVKVFGNKIDQISKEVDKTKPEVIKYDTNSGGVGFASNIKIISDALKDQEELIMRKEALEQRIKKDKTKKINIMGDKIPSLLEKRIQNTTAAQREIIETEENNIDEPRKTTEAIE